MFFIIRFNRIRCRLSQKNNSRPGLDKLRNGKTYFFTIPKTVNFIRLYFINHNKIAAGMRNERAFDTGEVLFLVPNPGSGIVDAVVGQHFGQSEQIVFVRVLVENLA